MREELAVLSGYHSLNFVAFSAVMAAQARKTEERGSELNSDSVKQVVCLYSKKWHECLKLTTLRDDETMYLVTNGWQSKKILGCRARLDKLLTLALQLKRDAHKTRH